MESDGQMNPATRAEPLAIAVQRFSDPSSANRTKSARFSSPTLPEFKKRRADDKTGDDF